MPVPEIAVAEKQCARNHTLTKLEREYYRGEQRIYFAETKGTNPWREAVEHCQYNLCGSVVDTTVDRLRITGITATQEVYAPLAEIAWNMFQDNRGEQLLIDTMTEAEVATAAYIVQWPDSTGRVRQYMHKDDACHVKHSTVNGRVMHAVLFWADDDNTPRATVYYPDQVQEYRRPKGSQDWAMVEDPQPNPFGFVPVYEVQGARALRDIVPLQDKLNKSVYNQWVAGEVFGQPFRAVTGLDPEYEEVTDEKTGKVVRRLKQIKPETNRFLAAFSNPDVKLQQLPPSDPSVYTAEQDATAEAIARVSSTPAHLLSTGGTPPSGAALQVSEARFVAKVRRRQVARGAVLGRMFTDAVVMTYIMAGLTPPSDLVLEVRWATAATVVEQDPYEAAVLMQTLGIPLEVILVDKLGYSPERAREIAELAAAAQQADPVSLFNAGNDPAA